MITKAISDLSLVIADTEDLVANVAELNIIEPVDVDIAMSQALAFASDLTSLDRAEFVSALPSARNVLEDLMVESQAKKLVL